MWLEVRRKIFHLFSLLYALLYWQAGRGTSLKILCAAWAALAVLEAVRLRNPGFNQKLIKLFGGIHRPKEMNRPSGILWTLAGAILTIFFIPHPDIVLAALGYLAVGDAAASLVGKTWGVTRVGDKSLEGSLACFIACWAVGAFCLTPAHFGRPEIVIGALLATIAEALPLPLDDNLWIPLIPAAALTLMRAL
jgi:dolichol kinase